MGVEVVELTYVAYNSNDGVLGLLFAYSALIPHVLAVVLPTIFIARYATHSEISLEEILGEVKLRMIYLKYCILMLNSHYCRREIQTAYFVLGHLINEMISLSLKYTIKQPRPIGKKCCLL